MLFLAFVSIIITLVIAGDTVVLRQGRLKGHHLTSRKGRDILAFQGIPYAKPPVGDLRFRPPQLPEPWTGELEAMQDGPACLQRNFFKPEEDLSGQEDCLYLNVYTPQLPQQQNGNSSLLLDVMFWIHGGALVSGSGSSNEYGPQYLLDKDVVLVSINYRLGPLGFLSTGDEVCPGNNGMKDQVAALRWVRDNIAAFGGNPNSVTIFGESSGGTSVHYHILSPVSKGLFHAAISQSGTALVNWGFAPNGSTVHNAKKLATLLNCSTKPSTALVSCLRTKDAMEIIGTDRAFMEWDSDPIMPFNIVLEPQVGEGDEAFMTVTPREALASSCSLNLVPWMVGFNSGEGAVDVARIFRNNSLLEDLNRRFDDIIATSFFFRETVAPSMVKNVTERIQKFYFGDQPINSETALDLRDMFTDGFIFIGTEESVKLFSRRSRPVYYYYFDYRGTNSYSSMFGDRTHDYGVSHQDDLLYLFPQDHLFPNSTRTPDDDKMVDTMTALWTNFAQTRNPTSEGNPLGIWQPVSVNLDYAHIDSNGLHMGTGLLQERSAFWTSLPIITHVPSLEGNMSLAECSN